MVGTDELRRLIAVALRGLLPELAAQPVVRARVVKVHGAAGPASELEPRYSVDVEVLRRDGEVAADWPVVPDVPVPVLWAGPGRGVYCLPATGAVVRLGFEYGDRNRPYIESVTAEGFDVPGHAQGELLIAAGASRVRIKGDGKIEIVGGEGLAGGVVRTCDTCSFSGSGHPMGSLNVEVQ